MDYLQDPIILAFLLLLAVSVVAFSHLRRQICLWLLLLTVTLFALPRAGVFVQQINLPLPLAHILAMLVIIQWFFSKRSRYRHQARFGYFFLIYAATAGLGLAIGLATGASYSMAFLELFFYLIAMGLFFYASETFTEKRHFLLFIGLILGFSVLVSFYGIAQRYLGSGILIDYVTYNSASDVARSYIAGSGFADVNHRVLSSYGDPNVLAGQLLVFAGIALALMLGKKVPSHLKLLCFVVLCANVCCIIFTGSRAGMITLAFVAMIVLAWRSRWTLLFVPVMAMLAFVFVVPVLELALTAKFHGLVSTDDIRRQFPIMAWELLKLVPFGSGFGNTVALEFEGFDWSFMVAPTSNVWTGFNSYWLNLFSRLGVLGLLSFILLLTVLFRYIWRQAQQLQHPLAQPILIGAMAGCVGQGVIWLVNNTYMLPGGGLNFWFMMGMMVAGCRAFAAESCPVMLPVQPVWSTDRIHSWPGRIMEPETCIN